MSAYWKNIVNGVQKLRAVLFRKEQIAAEKRIEGHEDQNDANKISALVAALNRIGDQNDAAANQQAAKWNRDEKRECWRIWLEISAIVAAFIAAGGIFLQQCTMQGTLDEMHVEQRPWVYTEIVGADSPMHFNGSGIKLDLHYTLKNVGKSAALNARVYALVLLSGLAAEDAPEEDYWGRVKSTNGLSKMFGEKPTSQLTNKQKRCAANWLNLTCSSSELETCGNNIAAITLAITFLSPDQQYCPVSPKTVLLALNPLQAPNGTLKSHMSPLYSFASATLIPLRS
jgi:hypothetical protein